MAGNVRVLGEQLDPFPGDDDDQYKGNGYSPGDEAPDEPDEPDYTAIFSAPDLTALIKPRETTVSREYKGRVNSLLKVGVIGAINTGNFADAATFLKHGPGLAAAAGTLAAEDEHARKALDIITSPTNPWAMFFLAAMPMFSQIARNHETQIQQRNAVIKQRWRDRRNPDVPKKDKPEARFNIKLPFGRKIPIRFGVKFKLSRMLVAFRGQTQEPSFLVNDVFTNDKVVTALAKQGINITRSEPPR